MLWFWIAFSIVATAGFATVFSKCLMVDPHEHNRNRMFGIYRAQLKEKPKVERAVRDRDHDPNRTAVDVLMDRRPALKLPPRDDTDGSV